MRKVLVPGEAVSKFKCPICGQIELLTEDEQPICQNCGAEMEVFVEPIAEVEEVVSPDPVEPPSADEVLDEEERVL